MWMSIFRKSPRSLRRARFPDHQPDEYLVSYLLQIGALTHPAASEQPPRLDVQSHMNLVLLVLLLLLLFGGGGFYIGGPVVGGSTVGLILLILLIVYLTGGMRRT